ncbi:MAG: ATP synthase F1 subunit epsilon [Bacteroidota bacterium]
MHLTILTPDKKIFDGDVQQVTFPGSAGAFQVLNNHAPLVSMLQQGTIIYKAKDQDHVLPIESGWVEVLHNKITVLVTSLS